MHSRDYRDIRRTLNSTPGPSRPHIMHIGRYNMGIPRMWTESRKILLYSSKCAADEEQAAFVARIKRFHFLVCLFKSKIFPAHRFLIYNTPVWSVKRASLSTVVCYSQRHYWQSSCYCLKNVVLSMFGLISGIEFSSNWTLNCALLVLGTLEDWDAAFSKCRVQLLRVNERRQKVRKATQICPLKTTQVKM